MRRRRVRRWLPIACALAFLAPGGSPAAGASAAPERLTFEPAPGTTFRVQAVYPNVGQTCEAKRKKDFNARYRGRLEVVRQADGNLALIDHLTFDEYLQGLAEMPRSWPTEALRAQVVAARTYALYQLQHPRSAGATLGYDICSTDQCQVYRGLSVEQGAFGDAWIRAVRSTRGRVIQYRGHPINAFYFSTSPGVTKRNFPGGSPLPYIRSVAGQDGASPLARWSVKVPLSDLGPILQAGKDWPGGAITSVALSGDAVRVSGSGRSKTIGKSSFRFDLNDQAACVFPGRYPTAGSTGSKLPQTVPSIDFSLAQSGSAVVLTGRGWGHGVGMSQYGAKALAEKGRAYADILSYYYAGLRPSTIREPGVIRVLVVEDASILRVGIEGSATAKPSNGGSLAPGDRFEIRGGETLKVRRGIGPDLIPVLTATLSSSAPVAAPADGSVTVDYQLSGAAKVSLIVARDGTEVFRTAEVSQTTGRNIFVLSLTAAAGTLSPTASPGASPSPTTSPTPAYASAPTALQPGSYEVTLEAYDGLDRIRSLPVALTVQPVARKTPAEQKGGSKVWLAIVAAVLLVGAGSAIALKRRRSPRSV
jgi:SpoIID/LytB domain protein